jgi:DNA-binding XRE family transcriptional regulator
MAVSDPMSAVRCVTCARAPTLLDERGRCERCVLDADSRAGALDDLEAQATHAIRKGVTLAQLDTAFQLFLTGRGGVLPGDALLERDALTGWRSLESAFLADDGEGRGPRLRRLRRLHHWTLEQFAEKLDVTPTTLALAEEGALLPDEALDTCSELFGLSGEYLMGDDD